MFHVWDTKAAGFNAAAVPGQLTEWDEPLEIMMVEDVRADAMLTKIAIESANFPHHITKVTKGDEVVSKLRNGRMCHPSRTPDLIILDLGLPGMDGFDILNEMANLPSSLRSIPIVIVTMHDQFQYLKSTYPLYILGYIKKPCATEEMLSILARVREERDNVNRLLK